MGHQTLFSGPDRHKNNRSYSHEKDDENLLVHLLVSDAMFTLDRKTVELFKSDFLTALVNPETKFKKPDNGTCKVQADPEYFSAFLHFIRFGKLPNIDSRYKDEDCVLSQADFWNVRDQVEEGLKLKVENITKTNYGNVYNIAFRMTKLLMELKNIIKKDQYHSFSKKYAGKGQNGWSSITTRNKCKSCRKPLWKCKSNETYCPSCQIVMSCRECDLRSELKRARADLKTIDDILTRL